MEDPDAEFYEKMAYNSLFKDLMGSNVEGVAVVTANGRPLAQFAFGDAENHLNMIIEILITNLPLITNLLLATGRDKLDEVFFEGEFGLVFLTPIGKDRLLVMLGEPGTHRGLVFLDVYRAKKYLDSYMPPRLY